ncbi:unnamed protein product [Paramecium sonneborni]|uniref:Uncharacterized protein n=1 Tax=Paramecium sonneborni TaxID=65129 RepID=A0A8S1NPB5_9CILI|nr:unnamed protein product [Paramecium sonneborni]
MMNKILEDQWSWSFFQKQNLFKKIFQETKLILKLTTPYNYNVRISLLRKRKIKTGFRGNLQNWDVSNTNDEIVEFKLQYLNDYPDILDQIVAEMKKKGLNNQIFNQIVNRQWNQLDNIISQVSNNNQNNKNISERILLICLQKINTVFIFSELLKNFYPIKELIKINANDRYDLIFKIIFENQQINLHQQIIQTL